MLFLTGLITGLIIGYFLAYLHFYFSVEENVKKVKTSLPKFKKPEVVVLPPEEELTEEEKAIKEAEKIEEKVLKKIKPFKKV